MTADGAARRPYQSCVIALRDRRSPRNIQLSGDGMKRTAKKWLAGLSVALLALAAVVYFGSDYILGRILEQKGLRKMISAETARRLNCDAGYLPLHSGGYSISSPGFIARGRDNLFFNEVSAARLRARCNLMEVLQGKWRLDDLQIDHLQLACDDTAAQHFTRAEFPDPELVSPADSAPVAAEITLHQINATQTDVHWGTTSDSEGELRSVRASFFPGAGNLDVEGAGGTFRQGKWPVVQVQKIKISYARPVLRLDEGLFTAGGESLISVAGNLNFQEQLTFDLQLTFTHCPLGLVLSEPQRSAVQGNFDGTCHLQKDQAQIETARAVGAIAALNAVVQRVEAFQHAAEFTGRKELAELPIKMIKAEFDWNWPVLVVKNFLLESSGVAMIRGEFHVQDQKIDGEFELGAAPDLVEKFPGAREKIFTRSEAGYLWTKLTITGTLDQVHDDLRPRLLRAAEDHFGTGLAVPLFKPGQTILQAIEAL